MKLVAVGEDAADGQMPPTRGHDLKLPSARRSCRALRMPPTRGHDLKLLNAFTANERAAMPPTRGHDLKPFAGRRSCG